MAFEVLANSNICSNVARLARYRARFSVGRTYKETLLFWKLPLLCAQVERLHQC